MLTAVDPKANVPIANINACKGLLYVGGPQCSFGSNGNVQTILEFYPDEYGGQTLGARLHSEVGWQKFYMWAGGVLNSAVTNPYDHLFEQQMEDGYFIHNDTDPVPPGGKAWDGELKFFTARWWACGTGLKGDPLPRLRSDVYSGWVPTYPWCKEVKVKLTSYQGPPPTSRYWYDPADLSCKA